MGCFIFKWGVHLTGGASALIGEGGFSKKIVGSEGGRVGAPILMAASTLLLSLVHLFVYYEQKKECY